MNDFGQKFLQYQTLIKLAKEIKAANPEKSMLVCKQEAYNQLKAEGKID